MDTPTEHRDGPETIALPAISGHVSFDNVTFGYHADRQALRHFSLEVLPGESVALVGPSGAGKTTVMNLLLGFYAPTEGRIVVDDHPLDRVAIASLRQQVAVVHEVRGG